MIGQGEEAVGEAIEGARLDEHEPRPLACIVDPRLSYPSPVDFHRLHAF